jgi:GNAT superfamily N-acetyltransferase
MSSKPAMNIRQMCREDLVFAAECTAAEGWVSEDLSTLEGFFLKDPQGCLLAEENGQSVGICIATYYGKCGFIGELIVHPEVRGRSIGAALLNQGVQLLKTRGAETVYLDGVVKAVGMYERNGFLKICRSWRFSGQLVGKTSPKVRPMTTDDLDEVIALDTLSFGTDRGFFLQRKFELFPELCKVSIHRRKITGYIMGRGGETWVSAGPWVREREGNHPAELLESLAIEAGDRPISLGILGSNHQACKLIGSLGFSAHEDSPWRMARGNSSYLGASPNCYAIGSATKG